MTAAADPTIVRKAAAFIEAIEGVEGNFGIDLDAVVPVRFTVSDVTFGLVRIPGADKRLGMVFPEPAGPRYPIDGRD